MLTATDPRVVSFYDEYHRKVKTRPSLYLSGNNCLTIVLPSSLLDYANASAGHSGFGAGARPVGIRCSVDDAKGTITKVFSSPEVLASFINSSECNAAEYIEGVRAKHLARASKAKPATDDRPARDVFFGKFGASAKALAQSLRDTYGAELVRREFSILTQNEFELRFGLTA